MAPQRAREAENRRADGECLHLEHDHPLAGDRRHLIVVADRAQHATVGRGPDALAQGEDGEHGERDDGQVHDVERLRGDAAAPRTGNARNAVGAVGQPQLVAGDQADDLREPERDDGQIVAPQARRGQRHGRAGRRGHQHRRRQTQHDRRAMRAGEQCCGIGAEAEEADEPEVDHPGHAPHHVQPERQQRVEPGEDRHRDQIVFHQYARSPRMPRGRSVRTTRIAAKPTTVR